MSGTAYSKFFWSDWESDPGLAQCSLAAQGLWMRMLCLAAQADPLGYVLIAGQTPTPAQIARHVRAEVAAINPLLSELEAHAVFSRDARDRIYNRRMVDEEKRRRGTQKGGKVRAASSPRNDKGNFTSWSDGVQPQSPESRIHKPEAIAPLPAAPSFDEKVTLLAKLGIAIGRNLDTDRNAHSHFEHIINFRDAGLDFDLDVIPCIEQMRASGRQISDKSIAYFLKPVQTFRQARLLTEEVQRRLAEAPVEHTDEAGWRARLRTWITLGYWPPKQGPAPRSGSCLAPQDVLETALREWARQGGHPREAFCLDADRYQRWEDVRRLRRDAWTDYGDPSAANVVPLRKAL